MTTAAKTSERFPLGPALTWLTLAAALVAAAGWLALNGAWGYGADESLVIMSVMTGVNWLTACLGAALVSLVARHGGLMVMVAYFTGASVRLTMNLLAIGLLYASQPTVALLAALAMTYLPLLAVEATLIARYLWRQGSAEATSLASAATNRPSTITEAVA